MEAPSEELDGNLRSKQAVETAGERSASSAQQKAVEDGLRVDMCGPLWIAAQMVSRDQGLIAAPGNPEDVRDRISGVTGC